MTRNISRFFMVANFGSCVFSVLVGDFVIGFLNGVAFLLLAYEDKNLSL